MSKRITMLQDSSARPSAARPLGGSLAAKTPYLIYLISSRANELTVISHALNDAGYHLQFLRSVDDAAHHTSIADSPLPMLILLDLLDADGHESDSMAIQSAREAFKALPILVIGKSDTLETRLAAFRAGACRYLCEPLIAERLLAILDTISTPQPSHAFRILLIDNDAAELTRQSLVLRTAGMHVQALSDPMQMLTTLDSFQPDVLILAIQLQGLSGAELAAIVREREDALHLPILFLSNDMEQQEQLHALNLGGDGILLRPVQSWQLIATVSAKARHMRQNSMLWQRLDATLKERQREQLALNQHAIVSVADRHGNITYVNDKFCAITGYRREELLGQNHRIVKSGLHDAEFYRGIWRCIAAGQVWQGDICNRRKDGSLYWVESTITPFLDAQGKPYQYVSIRTDISHVKAAEAAIRQQRDMHRIASEVSSMLMVAPKHDLDFAIEQALKFSGEQLGTDRAYLFLFSRDGQQMSNTHEWCAPGVKSERHTIQNEAVSMLPWWHEQIQKRGMVVIHDVSELPEIARAERECFEQQDIQSLFAFPIQQMGKTCGFIGYDAIRDKHKWNSDEIELLSIMADVIGATLARQHAEQHIELHKERLRRGQVYANIGTWEWYIQSGELFWSERIAPLFGYPEGDIDTSYDNFLAAVHPDDRQAVQVAVQACIEQDIPYEIEHRVIWPDGTERWLQERGGVVRDTQGKPQQMIGVVQDIDSRKRAELALIERERQLRHAQALAKLGNWDADLLTGTLHWSDEVYHIFGYEPASIEPSIEVFHAAVHPDDLEIVQASEAVAEKTGRHDVIHRIIRPDGSVRHVHELAETELNADGKMLRLSGTVQDISEQVEVARQLRETEERFAFAVEGAGDGIWDWNMQTQVMQFSDLYMRMLGYEHGELLPHLESWAQSIHPDEHQQVLRYLEDYLQDHIPAFVIEMRMRCKDESYKWILCRGTVVSRNEHGQALRMIGIQSDISDRKMAEQALIQAREEADRANRAKSEFLSSMSHELRTPMNAILGFGQLMEYDDSLQEEQRDNVNEIIKAGKHLLGLINEVLDLAKVESGHIDLSLEPVDAFPVVEECLSLIQTQASNRGIQISHSGLAGITVRADRIRLKQVLLNLLSNAVKYNHEGGSIQLSVEPREEGYLRIRVSDTGPGIAEEYLETLFQPFNRLDAENSEIEGSGIGLTISRRIVEMMGGSIGVESTLGKGSSFWIELPMDAGTIFANEQDESTATSPNDMAQVKPNKEQTILYIEDNPSNIKLVAQLFSRRTHIHLITAHLPELGIELALTRKPRIILLDINMPGINGYEVLQVFKRDPKLKDTPVVAITANAMPSDIARGKAAGFDAYLTKPLNIQEFYQVVDNYLMD